MPVLNHTWEIITAIAPTDGYRAADRQSPLKWVAHSRSIGIRHCENDREMKLGGLKVDGLCEATNTIHELNGYWPPSCKRSYPNNRTSPFHLDKAETHEQRYNKTNLIKLLGAKPQPFSWKI